MLGQLKYMHNVEKVLVLECNKSNISVDAIRKVLSLLRAGQVDGSVKDWAEFLLRYLEVNCAYKKKNFVKKEDLVVVLEFLLEFFNRSGDMRYINLILKYSDYRSKHGLEIDEVRVKPFVALKK